MSDSILSYTNRLPTLVIAGRPNVGKSTLFNRLIKKRRAITDPTPGVTRDGVRGRWELPGRAVTLIDTGGVSRITGEMNRLVAEKALDYVKAADIILLMVDVLSITPEDEELIEQLRPYQEKMILLVNKADNPQREEDVWGYYSLGITTVIPCSAAHGINLGLLEDAVLKRLAELGSFDAEPPTIGEDEDHAGTGTVRLALLGKPNTGKSTLANLLTGSDNSLVSHLPGTTRDIVEGSFIFKNREFLLLDTAGIRRKNRVTENIEYYSVTRAIGAVEDSDVVILMIDALEGLTDQDKKIAQQVVKWGRGIIIALNKWDTLEPVKNQLEAVQDRIRFVFPVLEFAPILPLSALKGVGVEAMLSTVITLEAQLRKQIKTPLLNKKLEEWVFIHPPQYKGGKRYKVKYITQVSSHPVKFRLFVNRKSGFPGAYTQYILNQIRKEFGFPNIPLSLEVRE